MEEYDDDAQEPETEQPVYPEGVMPTEEVVEPAVEPRSDDMSDLFEVPRLDDDDMDVGDVVGMDVEDDVMDGDLSDLVDVSEEDVMGEDVMGLDDDLDDLFELPGSPPKTEPAPAPRFRVAPRGKQYLRPSPQPGMIRPQEE